MQPGQRELNWPGQRGDGCLQSQEAFSLPVRVEAVLSFVNHLLSSQGE